MDPVELVVLDLDDEAVPGQPQAHGDETGVLLVRAVDHRTDQCAGGVGGLVEQVPQ